MDRKTKLLSGLDLQAMVGLEIGPLDRPLVKKSEGRVIYVDHTDTDALKEIYKTFPDHDWTSIVDVDAVWGDKTIAEAVGPGAKFDYVVASHVGEHVPDLITWLNELTSVIAPTGSIRLALPDKRFCFDRLRDETGLSDLLTAFWARARIPQPQQVIDFCLHFTPVNTREAWSGTMAAPRLRSREQLDHAFEIARSASNGIYHDVHCWAFTPLSFCRLMEQLTGLGLISLSCENLFLTDVDELEFFVWLAAGETARAADSWARMASLIERSGN